MQDPTFSVVALVREEPAVLERFARYYLALGAERVRFFFDGEAHEARAPDLPGVELTVCDRAWWQEHLGHPPRSMRDAHTAVFHHARTTTTSDWQFFCDADEFLVSDHPVAELLARVPADEDSLRIMNAEAVWGPGDEMGAPFACTWFRTSLSPRKETILRWLLPHRRWACFGRGLTAHPFGKHFLRRGADVDSYNCHRSSRNGRVVGVWANEMGYDLDKVFLAHFDAVSEARWTEKWRRRLSEERPAASLGTKQEAQVAAMRQANANDTMHKLFRELYGMSRYEATVLGLTRSVIRRDIFADPRRHG